MTQDPQQGEAVTPATRSYRLIRSAYAVALRRFLARPYLPLWR